MKVLFLYCIRYLKQFYILIFTPPILMFHFLNPTPTALSNLKNIVENLFVSKPLLIFFYNSMCQIVSNF
jgi:hypothetical protein